MSAQKTGPVSIAVVGLGRSGYGVHLKALRHLRDEFRVVSVCDVWPERADSVAEELEVAAHYRLADLLDSSEAELVVVAGPSIFHAEHTIETLKAGKHTICDKPFGLSGADAQEMASLAELQGLKLGAYYSRRYESVFRKVRDVIESGVLGEIVHVRTDWSAFGRRWDWQTLGELGGGQLNNNFPHAIDQGLELFRAAGHQSLGQLELFGEVRNTLGVGDADDHVRATLRVPGGMSMEIELLSTQAYPGPRWNVCGTRGGLQGDVSALTWKWVAEENWIPRSPVRHSHPDRNYDRDDLVWNEATYEAENKFSDWQKDYYKDFYNWIRNGAPPPVSLESACATAEIIDRIRKSANRCFGDIELKE